MSWVEEFLAAHPLEEDTRPRRYLTSHRLRKMKCRLIEGRTTKWGTGRVHIADHRERDILHSWVWVAACGSTAQPFAVPQAEEKVTPVTCRLCIAWLDG